MTPLVDREDALVGWSLGHRPSLDALRGIAVLLVLAGHTLLPAELGGAGVGLFFALSGYLITGILVGQYRDGGIGLRAFYGRRARRLLPALGILVAVIGLRAALYGDFGAWLPDGLAVSLYVGNWAWASGMPLPGLAHTWSLAIEEQFYLLWPVTLIVLLPFGVRRAAMVTGGLIGVSLVLAAVTLTDYRLVAVGFHTRAKDLLVGCLVALVCAWRGRDLPVPAWLGVAAAATVLLVWVALPWQAGQLFGWLPAGLVVAWFASRPRMLAWKPLTFTGRISYGLYLFHFPLALGPLNYFDGLAPIPRAVAIVGTAYVLAAGSWFLVERRFLVAREPRVSIALAPA